MVGTAVGVELSSSVDVDEDLLGALGDMGSVARRGARRGGM
jgi:hypothetical protein